MDDTDEDTPETGYYDADPETGRIEEKYTDDDFLTALNQLATDDYLPSTGDVADALNCNRETARLRLNDLADDGAVRKLESKAGFNWLTAEDEQRE